MEKFCHNNFQMFTFGDPPNLEKFWKSKPVKQKPNVGVWVIVWQSPDVSWEIPADHQLIEVNPENGC